MKNALLVLALLFSVGGFAAASPWGLGYQLESWATDLDASTNPSYPPSREPGFEHLNLSVPQISTWYLEEPGLIFGLISGMAETEANQVAAKQAAEKNGSLTYQWEYGRPAPIPEGRWNRWSLSTGQGSVSGRPELVVDYLRLNMDIVTGPEPFVGPGGYWMPSFEISGRSVKIHPKDGKSGFDFSTLSVPLFFHAGYQPPSFPWLTFEARAGWDFVSWGLFALGSLDKRDGLQNYTQGTVLGAKVSVGTDWLSIYVDVARRTEPLWNFSGYARRYDGTVWLGGVRLDVVNLIAMLSS